MIAAMMSIYSIGAWIAQYLLVLDSSERGLFLDFGRFSERQAASPGATF